MAGSVLVVSCRAELPVLYEVNQPNQNVVVFRGSEVSLAQAQGLLGPARSYSGPVQAALPPPPPPPPPVYQPAPPPPPPFAPLPAAYSAAPVAAYTGVLPVPLAAVPAPAPVYHQPAPAYVEDIYDHVSQVFVLYKLTLFRPIFAKP